MRNAGREIFKTLILADLSPVLEIHPSGKNLAVAIEPRFCD
jgi:hypothetical protein